MLASVGLDKMVWIWDGQTFGTAPRNFFKRRRKADAADKIRKLDLHSDFVKGVTWDPVGNYLATQVRVAAPSQVAGADRQSDDKTVKIWDAGTWQLVHTVEKPFENSPKSTFFRRLRSAASRIESSELIYKLVARWSVRSSVERYERADLRGSSDRAGRMALGDFLCWARQHYTSRGESQSFSDVVP
jgi:WD40 repeat protein